MFVEHPASSRGRPSPGRRRLYFSSVCIVLWALTEGAHAESSSDSTFLAPMPHILAMSVNPDTALRDRSCANCEGSPLGISCCGLCAFWENPLSQAEEPHSAYEGQCNARDVAGLLGELKGRGIDLEAFQPHQLFEVIRGRTLWLIGDSQMSYWYLAVECFLREYLVQETRAAPTGVVEADMWLIKFAEELPHRGSEKAEPKPGVCTLYAEGTRVCFVRIHLVEEAAHPVLRTLQRAVPHFHRDIAVVNAGLHYGVGDPGYRWSLEYFAKFVREHREHLATIIWKDTSPQHFDFEHGYYWWHDDSKGGTKEGGPKSVSCRPMSAEELASADIRAGGWFNAEAFEVMGRSHIEVFSAYNETLPLAGFHLKDRDCTHFCNPSAYELWTYLLAEKLRHMQPWLRT